MPLPIYRFMTTSRASGTGWATYVCDFSSSTFTLSSRLSCSHFQAKPTEIPTQALIPLFRNLCSPGKCDAAGGIYPPAPTLAWVEQETESSGGIKKRRTPSLHVGEGTLPGKTSRPWPAGWHYVPRAFPRQVAHPAGRANTMPHSVVGAEDRKTDKQHLVQSTGN